MQAVKRSGNLEVMTMLLKPLGIIQMYIEKTRDLPYKSSSCRILVSEIERARAVTFSNTTNPDWNEVLHLPFCHSRNEITIEVIGQDNPGR